MHSAFIMTCVDYYLHVQTDKLYCSIKYIQLVADFTVSFIQYQLGPSVYTFQPEGSENIDGFE